MQFSALFIAFVASLSAVNAAPTDTSNADLRPRQWKDSEFPSCAVGCIHDTPKFLCKPDDLKCLCGNTLYRDATSLCFKIKCDSDRRNEALSVQDHQCSRVDHDGGHGHHGHH